MNLSKILPVCIFILGFHMETKGFMNFEKNKKYHVGKDCFSASASWRITMTTARHPEAKPKDLIEILNFIQNDKRD